ncbi:Pectin lyase fold/virulence factor [Pseudocohnilembus persalinus]|uniref:Pectin lyase fold/virulence factor n=1 Tax=Pseudocohnilembus persalinus TaxID=266149 RepID=A0A0V0QQ47_PSEPJ|nr:Pectin lyase fold/virulence factor [Pseudocohnilembus persalinus]|eukprot:KRX04402.1 Pectin lyase fold/virulence factor [Pseudocohnilembus persalinus]
MAINQNLKKYGTCLYNERNYYGTTINNLYTYQEKGFDGSIYFFQGYSDNTIKNSLFDYNIIGRGGGISVDQVDGDLYVNSTVFQNSQSLYKGGGIHVLEMNYVYIDDSTFTETDSMKEEVEYILQILLIYIQITLFLMHACNSYQGSGIMIENLNDLFIQNTIFQGNIAHITGAGLYAQNLNSLDLVNTTCLNHKVQVLGGCMYIKAITLDFEFIDLNFHNNEAQYAQYGVGAYTIANQDIYFYRNEFINNTSSFSAGAIYDSSNYTYIVNNTFYNGQASIAFALYFEDPNYVLIDNNSFDGNSGQSACIYSQSTKVNENFIVKNSNFSNNVADSLSTVLYLENLYNVEISNLNIFTNINNGITLSSQKGGTIFLALDYLSGLLTDPLIDINNIQIDDNKGDSSGGIYVQGALNYAISLQNSGNITVQNVNVDQYDSSQNSILKIQSSKNLTILDSSFNDINLDYQSVINIQTSEDIKLKNFDLTNCVSLSGQSGGIYGTVLQNLTIENFLFQSITASTGSSINIEQSNQIQILDSQFFHNTATVSSGSIYLSDGTDYTIKNCEIFNNTATSEVGAISIQKIVNLTFSDSIITSNNGGQEVGGITVDYSNNIKIQNLTIEDNQSSKQGGGIRFQYSNDVQLLDSKINNNKISKTKGGGVLVIYGVDFVIRNSKINDNEAEYGAGIYIQQSQNIIVNQTEIKNNIAKFQGGAIYIADTVDTYLHFLTIKYNQVLSESGGGIYVDQISDYVMVNTCIIQQNFAKTTGGGIYVAYLIQLDIHNSQINKNQAENFGSGIYLKQLKKVEIIDSKFDGNDKTISGGALYSISTEELQIIDTDFFNNHAALNGGAIFIKEQQKVQFFSAEFHKNSIILDKNSKTLYLDQISSFGGSIYVDQVVDIKISDSIIQNSYSYFKGGGIYASNINNLHLEDIQIKKSIVESNIEHKLSQKDQNYLLSKGGGLYYEFNLSDKEIKSTKVKLTLKNLDFYECEASSGGGLLIKQNNNQDFDYSVYGLNFVKNEADIGPGARFLGYFNESFQKKISKSSRKLENVGYLEKSPVFYGFFRNERLQAKQESEFILCFQGQYLVEGGETSCEPCKENGICKGGYQPIYPDKNYWRKDEDSLDFYYCNSYPDACLGYACENYYDGVLCEDCDLSQNVFKNGNLCVKCASQQAIIINQIIKTFTIIALTISSVYSLKTKLDEHLMKKIADIHYSTFQSKILCDSYYFLYKIIPLHVVILFILTIAIPLLILYKLHKYYVQKILYTKMQVLRSYGLFYIQLSQNKYYWEFIWMYMKVLVVIIANFYPSQGTDQVIKSSLISCVLVVYAYLIRMKNPYMALTLTLGVCIVQDEVNNLFLILAFLVIFIANSIFFLKLFILAFGAQIEQNKHYLLYIPIPSKKRFKEKQNLLD